MAEAFPKITIKAPLKVPQLNEEILLESIKEVVEYLDHYAVKSPDGTYWKQSPEPGKDYDDDLILTRKGIYAGSAGIGLFYLELYDVTGDESYLTRAREAADYIIASYNGTEFYKNILDGEAGGVWPVKGWGTSMYAGPAGEGLFARLLYEKTGQEKYAQFFLKTQDDLISVLKDDGQGGLYLTDAADLMSDGSFVFSLLYAYRKTSDGKYLDTAERLIRHSDSMIHESDKGGIYWELLDLSKVGWSKGDVFPNFAHGTSGQAYLNLLLYEETGKQAYLDKAQKAFQFLSQIAVGDEEGALLPYLYSPEKGIFDEFYYLSFCHGPVGSTIFYRKFYELTKDEKYLEWYKLLTGGITKMGAPLRHTPGYWNSYCLCCGAPGVLLHFVKSYQFTGDEFYLKQAELTAAKLIGDSFKDEQGRRWYAAWTRKIPSLVETYTGLYSGAAGAARSLLALYAQLKGKKILGTTDYIFLKEDNA